MKRLTFFVLLALLLGLVTGCGTDSSGCQVAATTLPVYEFTMLLCEGTNISVGRLVTESVSCLHDYTLQVSQMRMIESAEIVVISGAGLEEFLEDALDAAHFLIDASENTHIHTSAHNHDHSDHGHNHNNDPHIWLSPENAKVMAQNICAGLSKHYPEHASTFAANLKKLITRLDALHTYGTETLSQLSCREMITFHDGFAYFSESFHLTILEAVEEESGSEASAADLKMLIGQLKAHVLPAIFTEVNGSVSAADVISAETGVSVYSLDMAISGESYFDAMYYNINTIKEALG